MAGVSEGFEPSTSRIGIQRVIATPNRSATYDFIFLYHDG
jgi:hypothetical protein